MTSKLASLHAGLVARKGEATPAVSHPAFSYVDAPRPDPRPIERASDGERRIFVSAVGRSGIDDARSVDRPAPIDEIRPARVPSHPIAAAPTPRPVREAREKGEGPYKLTFRMTAEQRRRLRIAAAQNGQSLQQLLSDALDNHIDGLCACSLSECKCLARDEAAI